MSLRTSSPLYYLDYQTYWSLLPIDMNSIEARRRERLSNLKASLARVMRILLEAGSGVPGVGGGLVAPLIRMLDENDVLFISTYQLSTKLTFQYQISNRKRLN